MVNESVMSVKPLDDATAVNGKTNAQNGEMAEIDKENAPVALNGSDKENQPEENGKENQEPNTAESVDDEKASPSKKAKKAKKLKLMNFSFNKQKTKAKKENEEKGGETEEAPKKSEEA